MDRSSFFTSLRQSLGTLSQSQVHGINAVLDEGLRRGTSSFHLAGVLAEGWHETGGKMQPIEENLNYSAKRMTEVWPSRFKTLASAKPYANNPQRLANKVYGGRLGNDDINDGWTYRGRGLAQITGKTNYAKFGIAATPERASEMATAVRILFDGMERGLFTGKKLADYDAIVGTSVTGFRFRDSRAIINGDVAANGAKIEAYGNAFVTALMASGYGAKTTVQPSPTAGGNWLAAVIKAIAAIFGAKS